MKAPAVHIVKSHAFLKIASRIGLLMLLVAVIAVSFFSTSSASVVGKPFQAALTKIVSNLNSPAAPANPQLTELGVRQLLGIPGMPGV